MDQTEFAEALKKFLENLTNQQVNFPLPPNCTASNALFAARSLNLEPASPFLRAKQNEWIQACARAIPYLHAKEGVNQFCGDAEKLLASWQDGGLLGSERYMADYFLLATMSQSGLYGKRSSRIKQFRKLKKFLDGFKQLPNVLPLLEDLQIEDPSVLPPKKKMVRQGTGGRLRVEFVLNDPSLIGKVITVKGWAKTTRIQGGGNFAFIELNDGSTVQNLQVIVDKAMPGFDKLQGTGISVACRGQIIESLGDEQPVEMHINDAEKHSFQVIGGCDQSTYPLSKKQHSLEFLRSIGHLRSRTNLTGSIARVRNALAFATHRFFNKRGFLYIHTPLITASDCEGAGEMFQVTTICSSAEKLPKTQTGEIDWSQDFFKKPAYLTVSGQLAVENYCLGLSDVYTFGPTFRAENSHTSRHLAEFWMIEPELAWADLEDDMECAESYLKFCIKYVMDNCPADLEFLDEFVEQGLIVRLKKVLNSPFKRMTYTEALEHVQKSGRQFTEMPQWGDDLQSEHERYVCEEVVKGPVIVYNYPKVLKAFYMKVNDDDQTVQAMDVLVPKIGEVIGGSVREDNLEKLDEMIRFKNLDIESYWWYRDLRKYGSVPHAGFGLGFERLVMMVTGVENIRDVIPYPRWPGHAEF